MNLVIRGHYPSIFFATHPLDNIKLLKVLGNNWDDLPHVTKNELPILMNQSINSIHLQILQRNTQLLQSKLTIGYTLGLPIG